MSGPMVTEDDDLLLRFFKRDKDLIREELPDRKPSKPTNDQQIVIDEFETILGTMSGIILSQPRGGNCDSAVDEIALRSQSFGKGYFRTCIVLPSEPPWNLKSIREHQDLRDFEIKHKLELVLDIWHDLPIESPPGKTSRPFKLAFFDMDSTLINEEVIDELARSIGVYDQVSAITHRAMNDPSFDFAASLKARVALLKGVPADIWTTLRKEIHIAPGAKELIAGLKSCGIITGVISGGFTPMAEWLKGELGLDLAFANHLSTSPSTADYDYPHLTGELDLSDGKVIVTPKYKKKMLEEEAAKHGIDLQYTLAAGDGSNDLKMLNAAGLGIAWNAKPKTQEMAPMRLNGNNLAELLCLLGESESSGT